ncbi:NAD(P)/FAD-dependent oxidoreductase [Nocardiopsis lucentensis]|uniref:NAD(P)/FAD-dependent oxidoreductase n=1 Tax=Nocardiopsis lucentensis TaxID=53441 RepID=UPI00034B110D|nr:FAD-dependent oxidoreductase [Nocardiopsis lucentensis]
MAHDILVLGAGYAGLAAARKIAHDARTRALEVSVTLVNASADFVERVRLHEVAAGRDVGVHPLTESLEGTDIDLVVGWVEALDPDARRVSVRVGGTVRTLTYDTLVHALGSSEGRVAVPGAAEHALTCATLDGARAIAARIASDRPERLAVIGGGHTGVELAAEIAESHPGIRVDLLTRGRIAPGTNEKGRAHVLRVFDRLGVTVRENTDVAEVDATGVRLADGARVPAALVAWTVGFSVSPLGRAAGLTVDDDGRALVDITQRSVSHPDVYVVGDAAHGTDPGGGVLRMSCATGLPMGWTAAEVILDRVAGREPKRTPFGYLNLCVSLGRRDGIIQFVTADDRPRSLVLRGRVAARYKEFIVAGAYGGLRGSTRTADSNFAVLRRVARGAAKRNARAAEATVSP